jgi:hypothetical protein
MGDSRKHWTAAKSKVKNKNWETQLKFKDDFGPNLDTYETLIIDVNKALQTLATKIPKIQTVAQAIAVTAKSYRTKIHAVSHDVLDAEGVKELEKGLDMAIQGALMYTQLVGRSANDLQQRVLPVETTIKSAK